MNIMEKFYDKKNLISGPIGDVIYINEDGKVFIDAFYIETVNQIEAGGIEDENLISKVPCTKEWEYALNAIQNFSYTSKNVDIKLFNIITSMGKLAIEVNKGIVKVGTFCDWRVRDGKRVIGLENG